MRVAIRFQVDNEAFGDNPEAECARILRELADRFESGCMTLNDPQRIQDINGNAIGGAVLTNRLPARRGR